MELKPPNFTEERTRGENQEDFNMCDLSNWMESITDGYGIYAKTYSEANTHTIWSLFSIGIYPMLFCFEDS